MNITDTQSKIMEKLDQSILQVSVAAMSLWIAHSHAPKYPGFSLFCFCSLILSIVLLFISHICVIYLSEKETQSGWVVFSQIVFYGYILSFLFGLVGLAIHALVKF